MTLRQIEVLDILLEVAGAHQHSVMMCLVMDPANRNV